MQMPLADVVLDAVDSALQQPEITLNAVRGYAHAIFVADVFSCLMINFVVLPNFLRHDISAVPGSVIKWADSPNICLITGFKVSAVTRSRRMDWTRPPR
jgi:hypothetical protein